MSEGRNSEKTVLIAASSLDESNWMPIAQNLTSRGFNVVTYEADKVADGRIPLEVSMRGSTGLSIFYDSKPLHLQDVAAGWYRRATMFSEELPDKAFMQSINGERALVQFPLWEEVSEERWLNSPWRIRHGEYKLTQLVLARELGFTIPDTAITNNPSFLREMLPADIIFKTVSPVMYTNEKLSVLYAKRFKNDASDLQEGDNPFPGIWQAYQEKAREWRITIVGDEAFDAAIYTSTDAKDDWRRHQSTSNVEFKSEKFPDEEKLRCFEMLGKLGLRFGCFDFIEAPDGKLTFLECNTNGQFGWLEDELGLPISSALSNELARIANGSF